jgi:integrase
VRQCGVFQNKKNGNYRFSQHGNRIMPRLLGRLPAYRKHKATGQAVVTLSGRDFYLGPYGASASKAEYYRRVREWNAAGGILPSDQIDTLTIVELLAAFWKHAQAYYVDVDGVPTSEQATYRTLIQRFKKAYGRTVAAEFGPLRLKSFRQILVDEGLSRQVVNRTISRVRMVFKWGTENELVPESVVAALRCVAGLRYGKTDAREVDPVKPIPTAYVDAVLPYVSPQVAAMIELQRVTGMRSGEVCRMRTCDIDMQGKVWTYTPNRHKTMYRGHTRVVYLGPKAQAIVKPWLRADLQAYLFQPLEAEQWRRQQKNATRKTPLGYGNCPGSNRVSRPTKAAGVHYTTDSYRGAVQYGCELAFGMPAQLRKRPKNETKAQREERYRLAAEWRARHCWHPHQLRHNHATMVKRKHGLEVARVLLGHKHAAITEIYAEADRERAVEVVAKIG